MDREKVNQSDDSLENALRQFAPRSVFDGGLRGNLDRDRLMFLAGQQSERPEQTKSRAWMWPAATFAMAGLAACFAIALGLQLTQPPREQIVLVPAPLPKASNAPAPTAPALAQSQAVPTAPLAISFPSSGLLQMRNIALRFGVESLPSEQATSTASSQPLSPWQQLRSAPPDSDSSL